jgi:hypothetical protein
VVFDTSPNGILDIISRGENQFVEFKTRFVESAIARHLVAFANSSGGILVIGVGDRGELLGLSQEEAEATQQRLNKLASSLFPSALYRTGKVEAGDKTLVFAVIEEAPASDRPIRLSTGDALMIKGASIVKFELAERMVNAVEAANPLPVFIAMSFRNEEEPALVDYFEAMQRAARTTGRPMKILRMDVVEGDYEISQQIMDEIEKAQVAVADFTLSPANVYFELGYARGRGKRIIQSARKGTVLEFDIRNWRTIIYKNATELEKALVPALNDAYVKIAEH